jgi:hypothetical protein
MITAQQRTERRTALGGSDIARAFTGKFGGMPAVILSKRGEPSDSPPYADIGGEAAENLIIEHGNWSEGPGLDWFVEQQGCELSRNVTVQGRSTLRVNLDGLIPHPSFGGMDISMASIGPNSPAGIPVEHKYVTPYTEHEWADRTAPNDYTLVQVHTQMLCCEADHAWVVVTLYWKERFAIRVPRSDALCQAIDTYSRWVWDNYVAPTQMPSLDFEGQLPDVPVSTQLREALNATKINKGELITLDEKDLKTVKLWDAAREAGNAFGRGADALRDWMGLRMGEAEIGQLPDGSQLVRKLRNRKAFSVAATEYVELKHTESKTEKAE